MCSLSDQEARELFEKYPVYTDAIVPNQRIWIFEGLGLCKPSEDLTRLLEEIGRKLTRARK